MATMDSADLIQQLIAGNGRIDPEEAPDNPWATKIVEYTNVSGRQTWGVVFEGENQNRYEEETPFVRHPRVIWRRSTSN